MNITDTDRIEVDNFRAVAYWIRQGYRTKVRGSRVYMERDRGPSNVACRHLSVTVNGIDDIRCDCGEDMTW